ncbi:MAG: helix-turn-helix transcriptional regulator [Oscillospiraceae bacterium]|nr:helix-turn-helix transcriptional regulator [Oscillospiraceae bacterium]
MSELSQRILDIILSKEVSYGELSDMTGIPKSALQRYATGQTEKIPIDRLQLIAKALGTTASYLMGWEENTQKADGQGNGSTKEVDEIINKEYSFNISFEYGQLLREEDIQMLRDVAKTMIERRKNENSPQERPGTEK